MTDNPSLLLRAPTSPTGDTFHTVKRASITLPSELDQRVDEFLSAQSPRPSLTALVQEALSAYLDDYEWKRREYTPAKESVLTVTTERTGHSDTAARHDEALAEFHEHRHR